MVVFPDGSVGRVDLTVALDIATRTPCAAILRPVATKAVDAAVLLARALTPLPMQPGWHSSVGFSRSILPAGWDDSESWRVTERIWDVARRLTQLRRDSLLWGAPVRDAHYNLLRFIDLQDPVFDDSWDDYGIRPATHERGDHTVADHRPV
jgi:hypothetical protein